MLTRDTITGLTPWVLCWILPGYDGFCKVMTGYEVKAVGLRVLEGFQC